MLYKICNLNKPNYDCKLTALHYNVHFSVVHDNPKYFCKNFFDMYALKYKAFVTNHVHSDYCCII